MYLRATTYFYGFVFVLCCGLVQSQNTKQQRYQNILKNTETYLIGEGFGDDPDRADKQALNNLASQISVSVQSKFNEVSAFDNKGNLDSKVQSVVSTYANATLKQARQIIMESKDNFKVLRYIKKKDLQKVFQARYEKVKQFVFDADRYAVHTKMSDALKYYYWALLLLYTHPDQNSLKDDSGNILVHYIPKRITEILKGIRIKVLSNTVQKATQRVALQFNYEATPVLNLQYKYNDGHGKTNPYEVNEGKGSLQFDNVGAYEKKDTEIFIEYQFEKETKQDLEVNEVIRSSVKKPSFYRISRKRVQFNVSENTVAAKYQGVGKITGKSLNLSEKGVKKIPLQPCKKNLRSALRWMKKGNYQRAKQYCTPDGEKLITKLFQYGNAVLLPITQEKFTTVQKDGNLQVRSIPVAFSFKNSVRNFTENVVFYFDENQKIDNVAFALNSKTFDQVMAKRSWTVNEKITLINFMEQYKTSYALKRLDYIESIFSNDALIIVGYVVKNTHTLDSKYKENKIVKRNRYTKKQFIDHLRNSFRNKEFVNLKFEDIEFKKSGKEGADRIFGVKVKQNYISSNYADQGYLFLLVDLKNPKKPVIHVRTWDPDSTGRTYDMGDFN